ncbi:MAG: hypothetical protein Q8904_06990 [Bacteroidota bacterium]|nr:hypothetical protein [Bacteroidota bacterium]
MKKLFSILFAAIVLLSGMHLSLATHLCGGELAAVKISFSAEKAGCGMVTPKQTNSAQKSIQAESCCQDVLSYFAVDTNYDASSVQIDKPVNQLLQVFFVPSTIGIQFLNTKVSSNTTVQPPEKFIASAVSLPDICVFLI